MYRLLIVDDEEIIVNSMCEMFSNHESMDLDIYRAFSGEEAIEWLNRTRIDIIISDIRMPEMDGLMLLEQVRHRWPWCKVIFLTGFNNFDYIYNAVKVSDVKYLLKSEDPDEVIRCVEEAVEAIDKSNEVQQYLQEAKKQLQEATGFLKRDFMLKTLQNKDTNHMNQTLLDELRIPLSLNEPVIYAIGHPQKNHLSNDFMTNKEHFLSIKKLLEQKIWMKYRNVVILDHEDNFHIITQRKVREEDTIHNEHFNSEIVKYLKGMLEIIQTTCLNEMSTPICFAIHDIPVDIDKLSIAYRRMNDIIVDLTHDRDLAVINLSEYLMSEDENLSVEASVVVENQIKDVLIQPHDYDWIEAFLGGGNQEAYFDELGKVLTYLKKSIGRHNPFAIEVYYNCATRLLTYINRKRMYESLAFRIGLGNLMNLDGFLTLGEAADYLKAISKEIYHIQDEKNVNKEERIISRINAYITSHLSEDLSLVQLSEYVYMSPSYLSRFYKRITCTNLSEFIDNQRISLSKAMLEKGDKKIYEIGLAVGYDNPGSFTRFFKKYVHLTPQEYIDHILRNN